MELAMWVSVDKHDERRRHAHAVAFDDPARAAVIALDLDDLDASCVLARNGLEMRLELTARRAAGREKLDEHGAGVAKDLLLKRGVVCMMEHGEILPRGQKALARPFLGVYSVVEASIMNALNRNVLPAPALAVALDGLGMGGRGSSLSSASSSSRRA